MPTKQSPKQAPTQKRNARAAKPLRVVKSIAFPTPPASPLTPELTRRFAELSEPTEAEQQLAMRCSVCGQAQGIPKRVVREEFICCVVCAAMLRGMGQPERVAMLQQLRAGQLDSQCWAVRRLPYFRAWLTQAK